MKTEIKNKIIKIIANAKNENIAHAEVSAYLGDIISSFVQPEYEKIVNAFEDNFDDNHGVINPYDISKLSSLLIDSKIVFDQRMEYTVKHIRNHTVKQKMYALQTMTQDSGIEGIEFDTGKDYVKQAIGLLLNTANLIEVAIVMVENKTK